MAFPCTQTVLGSAPQPLISGSRPNRPPRPVRGLVRAISGENGTSTKRHTTVHKIIEQQGVLLLPGIWDALSAKLVEQAGHKAGFISGYAVSATLLGEPDVGLLTPPEMARKTGQVCLSSSIPMLVDADTGGGNVLNVARTVRALMAAGAKGAFLEDQKWPKKSGHMRNKEVVDMDEFVSKICAAREAIGDSDFFLIARTDSRALSAKYGLEDAINRANLYVDAGADASFVEGPRSDAELYEIAEKTKGLRACSMHEGGITPVHTTQDWKKIGFHLVLRPLTGLHAATRAMQEVYAQLAADGLVRDPDARLVSFDAFNKLVGLEEHYALEERYGRGEGQEKLTVRVRAKVRSGQTIDE